MTQMIVAFLYFAKVLLRDSRMQNGELYVKLKINIQTVSSVMVLYSPLNREEWCVKIRESFSTLWAVVFHFFGHPGICLRGDNGGY
jgi:hypothetical protein